MTTSTMERPMRRGGVVGPVILIGAGVLFLLATTGRLDWSVLANLIRLWPVLLIAGGLDILIGRRSTLGSLVIAILLLAALAWAIVSAGPIAASGQLLTGESISQPLDGAKAADVEIAPGAGQLRIDAATEDTGLIEGQVALAKGERALSDGYKSGDTLHYTLRNQGMPGLAWPENWSGDPWKNRVWDLKLNRDIPMALKVDTGVGEATLDLSRIRITDLRLSTGIGQTVVTLPRQGKVTADINAGIGEVRVTIPAGMAARVRVNGGLGETRVLGDMQQNDNVWTSPDYGSAENQVDLTVSGGIGATTIQAANGG